MKKVYSAPEMEIKCITLLDVILASPTEGSIPDQGATLPPDIGGEGLN